MSNLYIPETASTTADLDKPERITAMDIKALPAGGYHILVRTPGEATRTVPVKSFDLVQQWVVQHLKEVG